MLGDFCDAPGSVFGRGAPGRSFALARLRLSVSKPVAPAPDAAGASNVCRRLMRDEAGLSSRGCGAAD